MRWKARFDCASGTRRSIGLLSLILVIVLLMPGPGAVGGERTIPAEVEPVVYDGVKYTAPTDKMGYVVAYDNSTGEKLWSVKVYTVKIDPNVEEDTQWIFITNLSIENGKLLVLNEKGDTFIVKIEGKNAPDVENTRIYNDKFFISATDCVLLEIIGIAGIICLVLFIIVKIIKKVRE